MQAQECIWWPYTYAGKTFIQINLFIKEKGEGKACLEVREFKKNEKSSTSLGIKEMKVKTTLRHHFTLVRIATTPNSGEAVEKQTPSQIVGRNVHWQSHHGTQFEDSSKGFKQN